MSEKIEEKFNNEDNEHSHSESNASSISEMFLKFQIALDERYDKQERIVKLSRDVTAQSKKVIFLLHRHFDKKDTKNILAEARKKLDDIQKSLLSRILSEIQFEDPTRFHRAYTNGVQEYIEALLFYEYLKNNKLLSFERTREWLTYGMKSENITNDCEQTFTDEKIDCENIEDHQKLSSCLFPLSSEDYILGVADMTGEIMRLAVNAIGSGNTSLPFTLVCFLRDVQTCFLTFKVYRTTSCSHFGREFQNKRQTLNECVDKVERVCYNIKLREGEKLCKVSI